MSTNIKKKAKGNTMTISLVLGNRFMKYGTMYKKQENGEPIEYEVPEELALELLDLVSDRDIPIFKEVRKPTKPSVKPLDLSKVNSTTTDKQVSRSIERSESNASNRSESKEGAVKV